MIDGVKIKKLVKHADDRGFFMEVLRDDDNILKKFGQYSMSLSYPGVIKAFHYHKIQDDVWFFPVGNAQVVLYDLRDGSKTEGETNVFYMGENNPICLYIPVGVAHGYKVLGNSPAVITYITTESYKPGHLDEYRISWDDPKIGFNWHTANK